MQDVLSCLPSLFIDERRTSIRPPPLFMKERRPYICPPFCGRANKQGHCLILWSVRSLYHTGLLQDLLYPQPRKKVLPWQHLLPDITEKLTSYYSCRGLECKQSREICQRNRKKCCHGNTCCQVCWIANELSSLWRGMESKESIKYLWVQETEKKYVVMATFVATSTVKKLISSNPCRGLECKEPPKKY